MLQEVLKQAFVDSGESSLERAAARYRAQLQVKPEDTTTSGEAQTAGEDKPLDLDNLTALLGDPAYSRYFLAAWSAFPTKEGGVDGAKLLKAIAGGKFPAPRKG